METSDLHRRDVDVVLAEERSHPPDKAGLVLMFCQQEMAVHRYVDPEAVDEYDPRVTLHERAGDLRRADLDREERRVPRRFGLTPPGDDEAARPCEVERVHEIHALLAERLEHALHCRRVKRLRVQLQDGPAVPECELRGPVVE